MNYHNISEGSTFTRATKTFIKKKNNGKINIW